MNEATKMGDRILDYIEWKLFYNNNSRRPLLSINENDCEIQDTMDNTSTGSNEYRPLFNTTPLDQPLFGVDTPKEKIINFGVGIVTFLLVVSTLITSFAVHQWSHWGLNVFFAFCIIILSLGHLLLIFWYRQGDLDPKFRNLIYFNSLAIILLCICALVYISEVKD